MAGNDDWDGRGDGNLYLLWNNGRLASRTFEGIVAWWDAVPGERNFGGNGTLDVLVAGNLDVIAPALDVGDGDMFFVGSLVAEVELWKVSGFVVRSDGELAYLGVAELHAGLSGWVVVSNAAKAWLIRDDGLTINLLLLVNGDLTTRNI